MDTTERTETGQWEKGSSGNPRGRATRAQERAYLDAIKRAVTPEEVETYIKQALEFAVKFESTRGVMQVLEYVADRTLGKPKQMIETGKRTPYELLAPQYGLLPADSEDEEAGDE